MPLAFDLPMAARFLSALTGGEVSRHTFQTYPDREPPKDAAPAAHPFWCHGTLDEVAPRLEHANEAGLGVSVTVNASDGLGRRYANMLYPRAVFMDFDTNAVPPIVFEHANTLVRTGRGWHAYFWLSHADPDRPDWKGWEAAQSAAAEVFGCERIVDRTKAMRLPGFYHRKHTPMLMELELRHGTRRLLPEVLGALGLTDAFMRQETDKNTEPRRSSRPSWWDIGLLPTADRVDQYAQWVDAQAPAVSGQGGHAQLIRVVKMGYNFGLDPDDAWPVVERFNERCDPPWRTRALRTQFDSAWKSRFDPDSFGSMLWVPRPEPIRHEGAKPPEEPPPLDDDAGVRRRIRRQGVQPPPPPPVEPGAAPDEPPFPTDDDVPPEVFDGLSGHTQDADGPESASDGGGDRDEGGADHSAGGGDHNGDDRMSWDGPPVNGFRVLSPTSPLESAKMFVRWRYIDGPHRTLMHWRKGWYVWSGDRYAGRSKEAINERLYTFAEPAKQAHREKNRTTYSPFHPNDTKVNKMRHALESLTFLSDEAQAPCWLDEEIPEADRPPPREIVACSNGLLHLPSQRFLGKRSDYFNVNALGVAWDENAPRPERWLQFLDELWPDDVDSHRLLQEWFGLSLTSDTSFHKALLIVGPRRSGKGTIARVLNAMHGAQSNVAWPNLHALTSRFGLAPLLDKTVAIIPDLRVSNRVDLQQAVELILNITGEDWLQVDRKNLPAVEVQIPVRFLLMSNLVPRLADAGGAFATRVLALQLEQSFLGREDRGLEAALRRELPGILLWAIEGWKRLDERGHFLQPTTAQEVLEELSHLSTPVQSFVEERCELIADSEVTVDELFTQWRKWCDAEGRTAVGEKATLVRNIRAAYPFLRTTRPRGPSGKRIRCLQGLRITYDDPPGAEQRELPGWEGAPPRD